MPPMEGILMQIKQWIVIAGLMVAAPLLVACGEEKAAEDAAPAAAPADAAPADAAPADAAPAEGEAE